METTIQVGTTQAKTGNYGLVDLTGRRFGHLTVVSKAPKMIFPKGAYATMWNCICDCGNTHVANAAHLKKGITTSCGCCKKSRLVDLTGQKFGSLTVVKRGEDYVDPSGNRCVRWHCVCECGNELDVRAGSLTAGTSRSCGCKRYDLPYEDLTGQKFGSLTVLSRTEDYVSPSGKRTPKWHCQCDCGKYVDVIGESMKNGNTRSCGCLRKGNRRAEDLTGQRFGKLVVKERAEDYVSPKGARSARWLCVCDCGNETVVLGSSLKAGKTHSCGCLRKSEEV